MVMLKAIVLLIVLTVVIHSSFGQDNTKKLSYSKTCRCNIKYSKLDIHVANELYAVIYIYSVQVSASTTSMSGHLHLIY